MPTTQSIRRTAAALTAVTAIGGLMAVPASATESRALATSSFVAYSGGSFTGDSVDINGCGFHTIRYNGSYKWYGRGQDGRMHEAADGKDPVNWVLNSDQNTEQSTGFGWKSMYIVC